MRSGRTRVGSTAGRGRATPSPALSSVYRSEQKWTRDEPGTVTLSISVVRSSSPTFLPVLRRIPTLEVSSFRSILDGTGGVVVVGPRGRVVRGNSRVVIARSSRSVVGVVSASRVVRRGRLIVIGVVVLGTTVARRWRVDVVALVGGSSRVGSSVARSGRVRVVV